MSSDLISADDVALQIIIIIIVLLVKQSYASVYNSGPIRRDVMFSGPRVPRDAVPPYEGRSVSSRTLVIFYTLAL